MVITNCYVNTAYLGSEGVTYGCDKEYFERPLSLSELVRTEVNNNKVQIIAPGLDVIESATPIRFTVLYFFYNYWYLIALIILGIITAIAL